MNCLFQSTERFRPGVISPWILCAGRCESAGRGRQVQLLQAYRVSITSDLLRQAGLVESVRQGQFIDYFTRYDRHGRDTLVVR
jgi:hypothetical protein